MEDNYEIRDLQEIDYDHGFIDILGQLTATGTISKDSFMKRFELMKSSQCYFIKVIVNKNNNQIVGTGTLSLEYKFIHECAIKGHIEDIVIDESLRGKSYGKRLLDELFMLSKELGCYKTALCCKDEIVGFYEKCGAERKGSEMVIYHDK